MDINDIPGLPDFPAILERFESKFSKRKRKGCWLWSGPITGEAHYRYGYISVHSTHFRTPRFSYRVYKGPIPANAVVMHTCDTPLCVNPMHLVVGTQIDNIEDMIAKKRHAHGVRVPQAILTPRQVRAIRADNGTTQKALGNFYGVSQSCISDVKVGRSWVLQGGAIGSCKRLGEDIPQAKLTEDAVRDIRASTDTTASLARKYGVSFNTARSARYFKTWRHV